MAFPMRRWNNTQVVEEGQLRVVWPRRRFRHHEETARQEIDRVFKEEPSKLKLLYWMIEKYYYPGFIGRFLRLKWSEEDKQEIYNHKAEIEARVLEAYGEVNASRETEELGRFRKRLFPEEFISDEYIHVSQMPTEDAVTRLFNYHRKSTDKQLWNICKHAIELELSPAVIYHAMIYFRRKSTNGAHINRPRRDFSAPIRKNKADPTLGNYPLLTMYGRTVNGDASKIEAFRQGLLYAVYAWPGDGSTYPAEKEVRLMRLIQTGERTESLWGEQTSASLKQEKQKYLDEISRFLQNVKVL